MQLPANIESTPARTEHPFTSRGLALAAFLLSMAFAAFMRDSAAIATPDSILTAFSQHKITWLCLGVAAWHFLQARQLPLRTVDVLAMAPAAALIGAGWGSWPWLGLAISLALLLCTTSTVQPGSRCGLTIGLALALHEALIPMLALLAGDHILAFDARIAGSLAQHFVDSLSLDGTTLRSSDGHALVLVWGCSSFSQIGDAMLLCASLGSLTAPNSQLRLGPLTFFLGLTVLAAIALNALRLSMLATSPELFDSVHNGFGATAFRLATLGVAVLAAFGYRRQCHCKT